MMRVPTLRRLLPAAVILGAAVAFSSSAVADTPAADERHIADKAPFQQCIGDAEPTTQNVPAVDIDGLDELPHDVDIMDTNPDWDEVVLDFRDHLSDDYIRTITEAVGLDADLNSPFSADANLYVAAVEEGAVPYIKDCLRSTEFSDDIKHIEENFEYRLQGTAIDSTDTAGFGITDDTITSDLNPPPYDTISAETAPGALSDAPTTQDFVPDDPLYQYQWNFKQVNAEAAWDISTGRDATVAVIDTGVTVEDDPQRGVKVGPDLKDTAFADGYDFVDDSDFVYDGHGHGTHVAGTIAQATDNGYGVAGLAYDAEIMPIRVLNDRGFGSVSDIADAVRWASDNGADIINMSLGGPLPSLVLKRAVSYAHNNGTLVVAAAGNSGKKSPSYPAAFKESFAVAATQYDQHTTFYSQWGDFVDIAAPGGNTRVDQNDDGRPDGILQETHPRNKPSKHEFALYMGTSMASPHVAAAAALVHATGVTDPDDIKDVLRDSADDSMRQHYDGDEFEDRYGAGIIQVDAAVQQSTNDQGSTRFGGALVLVLLTLLGLRRRGQFDQSLSEVAGVTATATTVAAGLFFLPQLIPTTGGLLATMVGLAAQPLAFADAAVVGFGSSVNPLLASFLIPLGAYALLAGNRIGRLAACGLALGMAAFCLTEAFVMTSGVAWIPGTGGLLDSAWLMVNGLLSLAIGYLGLKSK